MAVITASDRTYTLHGTTRLTFADAVARVRETLKEEGFGVLTEIDVQGTLREKLDAEMEPYLILGACNPTFAHRALELEPELGALLPCNVVVYEQRRCDARLGRRPCRDARHRREPWPRAHRTADPGARRTGRRGRLEGMKPRRCGRRARHRADGRSAASALLGPANGFPLPE